MRTKQSIIQTPIPTMELRCRRSRHASNNHHNNKNNNHTNGRSNCYCLNRNGHRNGHHQHFTFNRHISPTIPLTVALPKEQTILPDIDNIANALEKEISQGIDSYSSSKHESKSLPAHSLSHVSQSDIANHKSSVFSC